VALPRPNPILINAGSDALTPRQARWMTLVIARHANAFKFGSKTLVARPAVAGEWRAGVGTLKTQIRSVARAPAPA
jgi:hypothetical protein